MKKLTLLKISASIVVGFALIYPLISGETTGVMAEVETLGLFWSFVVMILFFIAVAFYAKSLQTTLQLVDNEARKADPKSVWFMLLIPYNFIEDFFIIHHVTESLKAQALIDSRLDTLKSFGAISGFGWCGAQIISLIPNEFGAVASLIAFVLWLGHWIFIAQTNKLLATISA